MLSSLARHPLTRLDALLAAAVLLVGESQVLLGWHDGGVGVVPDGDHALRAVLVLLVALALTARRTRPLPSAALVAGAVAAQVLVTGYVPFLVGLLPLLVMTYSVAAYAERFRPLVLLLDLAAVAALFYAVSEERQGGEVLFTLFVVLGSWVAGDVVCSRLGRATAAVAHAEAALTEQRAQIARELHDVIAHSVSVMGVQAGAARTLLSADPDAAREALLAVEGTARESVAELHRLLAVLRDHDGPSDLAPQPGLADVPALVSRMREAGLRVTFDGSPVTALPAGVDLAAYRILQEALTNALKHGGQEATVRLSHDGSGLDVEVVNETARATGAMLPGGHGLVGMRERAHLYGGTLEAGPLPGGGAFRVVAHLPSPATSGSEPVSAP